MVSQSHKYLFSPLSWRHVTITQRRFWNGEDPENKHSGGSDSDGSPKTHRRKWGGDRRPQPDTWGTHARPEMLLGRWCGQVIRSGESKQCFFPLDEAREVTAFICFNRRSQMTTRNKSRDQIWGERHRGHDFIHSVAEIQTQTYALVVARSHDLSTRLLLEGAIPWTHAGFERVRLEQQQLFLSNKTRANTWTNKSELNALRPIDDPSVFVQWCATETQDMIKLCCKSSGAGMSLHPDLWPSCLYIPTTLEITMLIKRICHLKKMSILF